VHSVAKTAADGRLIVTLAQSVFAASAETLSDNLASFIGSGWTLSLPSPTLQATQRRQVEVPHGY